MRCMFVTELTVQLFSGWLNAEAYPNMRSMSVTELTVQLFSGWLNAEAD